jgi:ribosomal protein L29
MKTADKKTLQTKSVAELTKQISEVKETLAQLKLDHLQNKLKNTRSIFMTGKEIAVMQSVLHEKMKIAVKEEKNG